MVDVQIRIGGAEDEELASLREWLNGEEELRGRVYAVQRPIGESELGLTSDALTVALGSGGAGTVLSSALIAWLRSRRTSAKITVKSGDLLVTLDIQTIGDVVPLLERVLRAGLSD